jgi:hypothetical protein
MTSSLQLVAPSQAAEPGKPGYIFPPGKYVLGGGQKPARGAHLFEIKKPFQLRPGQFILSGGPRPTDPLLVDDDLEVSSGDKVLFVDDDHVKSTETRQSFQGFSCTYSGAPIILVLDPKAKLRILAIDTFGPDAELGELYLHRHDGASRRLTDTIKQQSNMVLHHVFFSKEFALDGNFKPATSGKEGVETKEVILMPAVPAALLPTGKRLEK